MPHLRVWDIEPGLLCRSHLLGEHREIHAIWNIITLRKKGYSSHPETTRWRGRLAALYSRHESVAREMKYRGYAHKSPLDKKLAKGKKIQDLHVDPVVRQIQILRKKGCDCRI